MHKVLALKFRPQTFQEIIGQEHITITLQNSIKNNRFGHAYLFSGSRGVGKTTTARILAKSLNCERGISTTPCNKCKNCTEITQSSSIDVEEIDGASNRGINEIRELKEKSKYYPLNSKFKIFIIDEVHMLTNEAFNALLKILEEPPNFVIFIFATTEPHKIPVTILSRCQRFDFKRLSISKIVENFKNILAKEDISIPENILIRVAKKSEGSMRDGLSLLEQVINFYFDKNARDFIDDFLGITSVDFFNKFFSEILDKNFHSIISMINNLYYEGTDFKDFTKDFIQYLENLTILSYSPDNREIIDDTEENINDMIMLSKKVDRFFIQTFLDLLIKEYDKIKFSEFPEINFKLIILKVMELTNLKSIDDLINELKTANISDVSIIKSSNILSEKSKVDYTTKEFIWEEFLKFLSHKKPLVYGLLSDAKLISEKKEDLIIEVNKKLPNKTSVLDTLKTVLKEFSGKNYNIEIRESMELSFKHKILQNEVINDILNLFDGNIEEIKSK